MPPPRRKPRLDGPITRRTWLEWVGKATALSLSSYLIGCDKLPTDVEAANAQDAVSGADTTSLPGDVQGDSADQLELPDGSTPDTADGSGAEDTMEGDDVALDGVGVEDIAPPDGWVFYPSEGVEDPYDRWPVRTVDRQEIESVLETWSFVVDGMVEKPMQMNFGQLLRLQRQDQITDFHCVEGWSVLDIPWNGVHLSTILEMVRPTSEASYLTFHTIDERYNESLPMQVALEPKTLLAYGVNDATLPLRHGFPLRLVVPRLFGYKSAKYVQRIELTNEPVEGYWVAYGYGYDAEVQPERLREGKY